jgi:hypothetical protein
MNSVCGGRAHTQMLVRMWRNCNPCILLVEMQKCAATMEKSIKVLKYQSAISLFFYPKELESGP